MRLTALSLLALAACQDQSGTIELGLTTAPGATVLDAVETLRVTITEPRTVIETVRTDRGFDLALDVEATGGPGVLIVDGLDAAGQLVATGMSPPFSVSAIDAKIVVYMAAPMSIALAPTALTPARQRATAASLSYGAILAGGSDPGTGAALADVVVYNAYLHSFTAGLPLPAPRIGAAIGVGGNDGVYLLGGRDASGAETGTLWRFDTTTPPNGAYSVLADEAGYARAGEHLVPLGLDRFLVTGAPVLEFAQTLFPRTDLPSLPPGGAGVVGTDGVAVAVFAGATGITRFRDDAFGLLSAEPRVDARAVALPDRTILVAGGATDAIRVDGATGALTAIPGFSPAPCPDPELAATTRHVVVSCGGMTYVHDAATLALLATFPVGGTSLAALPTGQVLMLIGSELSLFTPPAPE